MTLTPKTIIIVLIVLGAISITIMTEGVSLPITLPVTVYALKMLGLPIE